MFYNNVFIAASLHLAIAAEALTSQTHDNTLTRNINYKQLLDFIRLLNTQNEKRVEALNDRQFVGDLENRGKIAQYKKDVGNRINESLQNILRIVQKNYDAYENNKEFKSNPESGVIFISNPKLIEEYNNDFKKKDALQAQKNQLRRKIERSSSFISTSSASLSSDESDDVRRNLKGILQNIRKNAIQPLPHDSKELLVIERRNKKKYPKQENIKEYSIEKAVWEDDALKQIPKKKKDFSYAFDTNQHASRNKKDFSPRKRPAGVQPSSKLKFDSYKSKKESNLKRNEDYRAYGRTSIPVVGKKAVYDKK